MPCHLIEIVIDKAWFHDTNSITVFTNRLLLSLFWRGVRTAHVALMHDFWDRSAPFDTIQKKQVWAGRIPKKQFGSICDSSSDCSSIRVLLREKIWWLGSKKDPLPCSPVTHITWRVPGGREPHWTLGNGWQRDKVNSRVRRDRCQFISSGWWKQGTGSRHQPEEWRGSKRKKMHLVLVLHQHLLLLLLLLWQLLFVT